jgi:hypothetical protein
MRPSTPLIARAVVRVATAPDEALDDLLTAFIVGPYPTKAGQAS